MIQINPCKTLIPVLHKCILKYSANERNMTCTCGMSAVDRLREEAIADWPDWFSSSPPPFPPPSFPPPSPPRLSPPPPPSSPPPPPPLLCTIALGMGGWRVDIFNISLSLTFYNRSKQQSPPKLIHLNRLQTTLLKYFLTFYLKVLPPPREVLSVAACTTFFSHRSFFTVRFGGRGFL